MKKAIPMFAIAIILLALTFLRLPEGIRNVDIVSLLGGGVLIGVLLMSGIQAMRAN